MTGGVFFIGISVDFFGPPTGCGGRFLEVTSETEEEDRLDCVDMIFQRILNTPAPRWAENFLLKN